VRSHREREARYAETDAGSDSPDRFGRRADSQGCSRELEPKTRDHRTGGIRASIPIVTEAEFITAFDAFLSR